MALQGLNVGFAIDRGGLVGEDGPTHHGTLDLSYLGQIPNLVVMAPKDENEFRHMLKTMVAYDGGPVAVRYPRDYGYGVKLDRKLRTLDIGKGELVTEGEDVVLVAIGSMVVPCCEAAARLAADGISCSVINARFVKPLDRELLTRVAAKVKLVCTVEENVLRGGFGTAVSALLSECEIKVPVTMLGLPDRFISYAARHELLEEMGLTPDGIARSVINALSRCR